MRISLIPTIPNLREKWWSNFHTHPYLPYLFHICNIYSAETWEAQPLSGHLLGTLAVRGGLHLLGAHRGGHRQDHRGGKGGLRGHLSVAHGTCHLRQLIFVNLSNLAIYRKKIWLVLLDDTSKIMLLVLWLLCVTRYRERRKEQFFQRWLRNRLL